ncbi:unnamed protein product [Dovyalis caffra]|uniref:Uncharacterized protein n=1 Tax=Dovyalis caffra TaxID=77055 RepID=A0AAV1RVM7_9ROSI|nr:unnamed protein product [Dovyalis caffra]
MVVCHCECDLGCGGANDPKNTPTLNKGNIDAETKTGSSGVSNDDDLDDEASQRHGNYGGSSTEECHPYYTLEKCTEA